MKYQLQRILLEPNQQYIVINQHRYFISLFSVRLKSLQEPATILGSQTAINYSKIICT
jgi:hypothetical protein